MTLCYCHDQVLCPTQVSGYHDDNSDWTMDEFDNEFEFDREFEEV